MFLNRGISTSIKNYSEQIDRLKRAMKEADAVIVGAGAGLSTAAGFKYDGERFKEHFADFEEKYAFHDMYSGGFYPYDTPEEYWAYWSRYIYINRYTQPPEDTYGELLNLVRERDYFIITTNVDHCFQKAGFDKKRLFYTQGDYGLFQCSRPCRQETFDNEKAVCEMLKEQKNMKIPSEFVPVCPHCGRRLVMNLRSDDKFAEDEGWHAAAERYSNFLRTRLNGRVLFLELGVGYNTPGIIKYPFWQMTYGHPQAVYACINAGQAVCPEEIKEQAICLNADINQVIKALA